MTPIRRLYFVEDDDSTRRALEGLNTPRVLHKPFDNEELAAAIAAIS